jgi:UDP-N-acetylmuramoyl-tripeptide--D-alanyl-D-alanine ligase
MELTLQQILAATRGRLLQAGAERPVTAVIINSRLAGPGSLFVPLVGSRADGHEYIADALGAGAACFVKKGHPACAAALAASHASALIEVDDPLQALGDLAAFWRRLFDLKVVAITGSNGKTSTKEMAACIIERVFSTLKNPGNFNNLIGLPLSLFSLDRKHQAAVLELGMSEPGEIARLSRMCDPDIGLITNVGPSHLEQLQTLERVAAAKQELFTWLGPQDLAIINMDDERVAAMCEKTQARRMLYGSLHGQVHAGPIHVADCFGTQFDLHIMDRKVPVRLQVPGGQFVINAVAAASIATGLGIGPEDIQAGLEAFRGVPGRMETLQLADCTFINDAYNANPVSTKAALAALAGFAPKRRTIAVLGDMLELGEGTAAFHRDIGRTAAQLHIDYVLATGDFAGCIRNGAAEAGMNMRALHVCDTLESLAGRLREIMAPDDVILLKGSRRMKMEKILEYVEQGRAGEPITQIREP